MRAAANTSSLFLLPSTIKYLPSIMSIISDAIQDKCLAFSDRIIKLNDYLLKEAANKMSSSDIPGDKSDVLSLLITRRHSSMASRVTLP